LRSRRTAGQRAGGGELRAVDQAEPFLGAKHGGLEPALRQRRGAGMRRPPKIASPSPIIAAAMWASGARSPDAPTEPCTGDHRRDAARQHVLDQRADLPATPEAPRPSESSLSAIISRVVAGIQRLTDAAAMRQDQVALQLCRVLGLIRTLASLPKPVLTP
jgi:hypothetical protein